MAYGEVRNRRLSAAPWKGTAPSGAYERTPANPSKPGTCDRPAVVRHESYGRNDYRSVRMEIRGGHCGGASEPGLAGDVRALQRGMRVRQPRNSERIEKYVCGIRAGYLAAVIPLRQIIDFMAPHSREVERLTQTRHKAPTLSP